MVIISISNVYIILSIIWGVILLYDYLNIRIFIPSDTNKMASFPFPVSGMQSGISSLVEMITTRGGKILANSKIIVTFVERK
jgi:hypothetical protein